jgi:hypothetical protein
MEENALPAEVRRLIEDVLESMDHVEILYRLSRGAQADADWLARDTHVDPARTNRVLRDLERAKLVLNADGVYRLTQSPRDQAVVAAFATAYEARPVTLIRAVYGRTSPVQLFADAFRLRRDE